MSGIGGCPVWVGVEVARHAIHLHHLIDVATDNAIVVTLLRKVVVVVESTFVGEQQCSFDITLYRTFIGREGEKQFVKPPDVLFSLYGTVL